MAESENNAQVLNDKDDKLIMLELTKFCYENFDKRRNKEWKFSIAIWTCMAAFIAICFKECVYIDVPVIVLVIIGAAIVVFQSILLLALFNANEVDKSKSHFYEDVLNKSMNINYRDNSKVKAAFEKNRGKKWATPIIHGLITVLLVLLAVLVLHINKQTEASSAKVECNQTIKVP